MLKKASHAETVFLGNKDNSKAKSVFPNFTNKDFQNIF